MDGKTKDFKKYCNIPGICVPTMNVFKHEDCIEEERDERKKSKERRCCDKNWFIFAQPVFRSSLFSMCRFRMCDAIRWCSSGWNALRAPSKAPQNLYIHLY